MIQEELDKQTPEDKAALEAKGQNALEVTAEGAIVENEDADIDQAFDVLTADSAKESKDAMAVSNSGAETARKIQMAFEKGDTKSLSALVDGFVNQAAGYGMTEATAKSVLREQLKAYHDTYFEAGLKEKAAEIDAFSRSLESKADVSTDAGRAFVAKLDAGEFASIEQAINALDNIKNEAKGTGEEELNAEFNVLYAKINEKFLGNRDSGEHKIDIGDEDIDDVLGALG